MLIREIIQENYADSLIQAVQNSIALLRDEEVEEISTQQFKKIMADQGFSMTDEELIAAVDASGFVNSIDKDTIVPKGILPDDVIDDPEEFDVEVNQMAQDQAMDNIKDEL